MPCFRDGVPRKRNHNHRNYRGVTATAVRIAAASVRKRRTSPKHGEVGRDRQAPRLADQPFTPGPHLVVLRIDLRRIVIWPETG